MALFTEGYGAFGLEICMLSVCRIVLYFIALVLPFGLIPLAAASADVREKPRIIAWIIGLTGHMASWGDTAQKATELALESLPQSTRSRFKVVFEDDQGLGKNTVAALRKLIMQNKVDVVITASSPTSKAIAPLIEQHGLVHIAIASDPEISQGRSRVVNFWQIPTDGMRPLVEKVQSENFRSLARFTTQHDGYLINKAAVDKVSGGSLAFVLDEEISPGDKDFRVYFAKLKAMGEPEAIMILLQPGQAGLFAKQAREMGIQSQFLGMGTLEDKKEIEIAGGALIGTWYTSESVHPEFLARFTARYPNSSTFAAGAMHDAVLLAAAGIRKSANLDELNQFLHSVKDFKGVVGTFSASSDNRFHLPASLKRITPGGYETLQ